MIACLFKVLCCQNLIEVLNCGNAMTGGSGLWLLWRMRNWLLMVIHCLCLGCVLWINWFLSILNWLCWMCLSWFHVFFFFMCLLVFSLLSFGCFLSYRFFLFMLDRELSFMLSFMLSLMLNLMFSFMLYFMLSILFFWLIFSCSWLVFSSFMFSCFMLRLFFCFRLCGWLSRLNLFLILLFFHWRFYFFRLNIFLFLLKCFFLFNLLILDLFNKLLLWSSILIGSVVVDISWGLLIVLFSSVVLPCMCFSGIRKILSSLRNELLVMKVLLSSFKYYIMVIDLHYLSSKKLYLVLLTLVLTCRPTLIHFSSFFLSPSSGSPFILLAMILSSLRKMFSTE